MGQFELQRGRIRAATMTNEQRRKEQKAV